MRFNPPPLGAAVEPVFCSVSFDDMMKKKVFYFSLFNSDTFYNCPLFPEMSVAYEWQTIFVLFQLPWSENPRVCADFSCK